MPAEPRYTVLVKSRAYSRRSLLALGASGLVLAACRNDRPLADSLPDASLPPDELLVERLAVAYGALRDVSATQNGRAMVRYAQAAVDAIAGPRGRHGQAYAPPGGILPGDDSRVTDEPGLVLRAYDLAPVDSPLRAALDGQVVSSVTAWATPATQYDAIDGAVAAWTPAHDAVSVLDGAMEQALAWALLVPKTERLADGRAHGERGAKHVKVALDAVRRARAGHAA